MALAYSATNNKNYYIERSWQNVNTLTSYCFIFIYIYIFLLFYENVKDYNFNGLKHEPTYMAPLVHLEDSYPHLFTVPSVTC